MMGKTPHKIFNSNEAKAFIAIAKAENPRAAANMLLKEWQADEPLSHIVIEYTETIVRQRLAGER